MAASPTAPRVVGRYELHRAIASGGMATVHLGRLRAQGGFSRIVAIKRLHPSFAETPMLVSTLLDEARLCSRIQHANVVATLDMVVEDDELSLVLEYVHGETLARLLDACETPPAPEVVASIMAGALHGLHAAHEATSAAGEPLGLVHRDVSPQNIMVGVDGLARVLDFGVAKARGRLQTTREGQVKGKLAYMAPEQIRGHVDRRSDIFAAGVVMWEALTAKRLFAGDNEGHVLSQVLEAEIEAPSAHTTVDAALDQIVLRALTRDPDERFATAHEFALAIEDAVPTATTTAVGAWVRAHARTTLDERAAWVAALELGKPNEAAAVTAADLETLPDATPEAQVETRTDMALGAEPTASRRWLPLGVAAAAVGLGAILLAARQPTAAPPTPSVEPRAASSVDIEVIAEPAGARLWLDDRELGATPITFSVAESKAPITVRVVRDGHRAEERQLVPDRTQRLELTLVPLPPPAASVVIAPSVRPSPPNVAPRVEPPPPPPDTSAAPKPSPFYRFE